MLDPSGVEEDLCDVHGNVVVGGAGIRSACVRIKTYGTCSVAALIDALQVAASADGLAQRRAEDRDCRLRGNRPRAVATPQVLWQDAPLTQVRPARLTTVGQSTAVENLHSTSEPLRRARRLQAAAASTAAASPPGPEQLEILPRLPRSIMFVKARGPALMLFAIEDSACP